MKKYNLLTATIICITLAWACNNEEKSDGANHEMNLCNTEFVFVEGGTFTMGCTEEQSNDCYNDEKPAHEETVKDFYIGKYEVTVEQFAKFIEETGYKTDAEKSDSSLICADGMKSYKKGVNWRFDSQGSLYDKQEYDHPVAHVSWNDAKEYCKWFSEKCGKEVRLPSETEWEYAARGGNLSRGSKYSGSNVITEVAWYDANSNYATQPVGKKKANELGIFDMSGNVYEWCSTWYSNFGSEASDVNDEIENKYIVVRGGSSFLNEKFSRVSYRYSRTPSTCGGPYGFRLAMTAE
ncbi:MAG: formylglycine-generating enzyme family protein [Bacteroidales bacterium]|nr:formylglycine-generating enzyme family protein [Bacteroidales bacterium]